MGDAHDGYFRCLMCQVQRSGACLLYVLLLANREACCTVFDGQHMCHSATMLNVMLNVWIDLKTEIRFVAHFARMRPQMT